MDHPGRGGFATEPRNTREGEPEHRVQNRTLPCCERSRQRSRVIADDHGRGAWRAESQKSQSSSVVSTALPMTYEDPDPEKKSWFSSAFGDSAARIAGLTSVSSLGNSAS